MKIRDLLQELAKFDDDLIVVFCSESGDLLKLFKFSDVGAADSFIGRTDDGDTYCKFGRTPIS